MEGALNKLAYIGVLSDGCNHIREDHFADQVVMGFLDQHWRNALHKVQGPYLQVAGGSTAKKSTQAKTHAKDAAKSDATHNPGS